MFFKAATVRMVSGNLGLLVLGLALHYGLLLSQPRVVCHVWFEQKPSISSSVGDDRFSCGNEVDVGKETRL